MGRLLSIRMYGKLLGLLLLGLTSRVLSQSVQLCQLPPLGNNSHFSSGRQGCVSDEIEYIICPGEFINLNPLCSNDLDGETWCASSTGIVRQGTSGSRRIEAYWPYNASMGKTISGIRDETLTFYQWEYFTTTPDNGSEIYEYVIPVSVLTPKVWSLELNTRRGDSCPQEVALTMGGQLSCNPCDLMVQNPLTGDFELLKQFSNSAIVRVSLDELPPDASDNRYNFKYWFKVNDPSPRCTAFPDETEAKSFTFYPKPPEVAIAPNSPTCKNGTNGTVKITHDAPLPTFTGNFKYVYTINSYSLDLTQGGCADDPTVQVEIRDILRCEKGVYNYENKTLAREFVLSDTTSVTDEYGNKTKPKLGAGIYILKIESQLNNVPLACIVRDTFEIFEPTYTALTVASITITPLAPSCKGNSNGQLQFKWEGAVSDTARFKWKKNGDNVYTSVANELRGFPSGAYEFNVTDGCDTLTLSSAVPRFMNIPEGVNIAPTPSVLHPTCSTTPATNGKVTFTRGAFDQTVTYSSAKNGLYLFNR